MERYIKIGFVLLFSCVALISNAWAILLGISLGCTAISALFSKYYCSITIPVLYLLVAFMGQSYVGIAISAFGVYACRCVISDKTYNKHHCLCLFFAVITIGSILYISFLSPIFFILTVSTIPIYEPKHITLSKAKIVILMITLYVTSIVYIVYGYKDESKRAYLQHGVWAKTSPTYSVKGLDNASCYSYSEFVTLLNADTISNFNQIYNYNELWIVTPTKPFNNEELVTIKNWVFKGGKLIVVSDHTDLYGHSRCTNQLASIFGCKIHQSATFDSRNRVIFNDAYASPVNIKTGTNMTGMVFPLVASWLWEEDTYYANSNFFGPLSPSGDDSFGEKLIVGQTVFGLGQVSFLQDSTIFANFSVYQPYVMDVANIVSIHSYIARLFFLLPLILALCMWACASGYKMSLVTLIIFFPFTLPISKEPSFNYGKNPQIWTGDYSFILENGCPYANISTAYSLAALSQRKPLWKESVKRSESDIIWVDSTQPPSNKWRWIKTEDSHIRRNYRVSDWAQLYTYLDAPYIRPLHKIYNNYYRLYANAVFSDVVMNDWWYNDGISNKRCDRIKSWLAWLNKSSYIAYRDISRFTQDKHSAIVSAKGKDRIVMQLPKPLANSGSEVYFGNGIVGILYMHGDTLSVFGKKQYSENINCPEVWTIDYIE